jgi:uncharacterized protein
MIRTIRADDATAVLREGRTAHLGCLVRGEPYVVPINYVFDGRDIFVHSLPGLKIQAMRSNPPVCVQFDEIQGDTKWKSVQAFGSFEELVDPMQRSRALELLLDRFPKLTPVETRLADDAAAPELIVFRIRVDRVTGIEES